ncbi:MAG: hypothetical protein NE334_09430 [Lentisphaeraceae bacterium]|nr:hypothetical protein [Lentisphaeraceae bacterium]
MKPTKIIVLYSSGHLGSSILLNKLLSMPEFEVCGLVKSKALKTNNLQKIQKQIKQLGFRFSAMLIWQRIVQDLSFSLAKVIPANNKQLKQSNQFANDLDIHFCEDINSKKTQKFIKNKKPRLLISAFYPQILKKETLSIPQQGVLNIHPGILPDYKGAMSYFHVLAQNDTHAGVTLHWMDEGIDTGKIISQKTFPIKSQYTQETIMIKSAFLGSQLLKKVGIKIQKGQEILSSKANREGHYYSMPSKTNFRHYLKTRRFFRIRDIFGLIVLKPFRHFLKRHT